MKEAHLIDVFQFVYDLIYHWVSFFHFDFRVGSLSLNAIAYDSESVAVNRRQRRL